MDTKNPFSVLATREVYENPWLRVVEHRVMKPRGGEGIYGVVHFKHRAIGVVPYQDGRVWLVGQYRFPIAEYSWEIPEGGVEPGESLEDCVRRELAEETGLSAKRIDKLFTVRASNAITDEEATVFLARGLTRGATAPDDTEVLSHRQVSVAELLELVLSGQITDALTVAAAFRLKLLELSGEL